MNRLGFHYYPDTFHYRQSDLHTWLPELHSLGCSWLILKSPIDRAIPEDFLRAIIDSGIEPIIHFSVRPDQAPTIEDFILFYKTYARWNVRYICLFDKPNSRAVWSPTAWAKQNLVERFLDLYLPLVEAALEYALTPIFPPLEPGGDYWDTSFLRGALQGIQRRGHQLLLDKLVLSAYTQIQDRALMWGLGGPERWPGVRPYFTPKNEQDQRGFRIFDWYQTIARAVLMKTMPIILMGIGQMLDPVRKTQPEDGELDEYARKILTIAKLLEGEVVEGQAPVPEEVIAGNFWLLSAEAENPHLTKAWYKPDGTSPQYVNAYRLWVENKLPKTKGTPKTTPLNTHPIHHYLLLPSYEWGVADWHIDAIRPYVKKYRPTIGFSPDEAQHAVRVTVIGNDDVYPESVLNDLRRTGSIVERIDGDGTSIATQLRNR